jgi:hypothetical protein
VFADYDDVCDLANQLVSETHHGQSSSYTHDLTGPLTAADHQTQTDESYSYDANANRVSSGYVVGPNNQVLSDATFDYAYDAEGNLVRQRNRSTGDFTEFEFDHRQRMVSATTKSSGGIILREANYTYDVFDRRIAKTVDLDGAGPQAPTTTRFVYHGDHVWADLDASGQMTARDLFGDRTHEPLARWRPDDGTAWYLTDHLGTVRDIANAAGLVIINHLDYDSFGNFNSPLTSTDPTGETTMAEYAVKLGRGVVGTLLANNFYGCVARELVIFGIGKGIGYGLNGHAEKARTQAKLTEGDGRSEQNLSASGGTRIDWGGSLSPVFVKSRVWNQERRDEAHGAGAVFAEGAVVACGDGATTSEWVVDSGVLSGREAFGAVVVCVAAGVAAARSRVAGHAAFPVRAFVGLARECIDGHGLAEVRRGPSGCGGVSAGGDRCQPESRGTSAGSGLRRWGAGERLVGV